MSGTGWFLCLLSAKEFDRMVGGKKSSFVYAFPSPAFFSISLFSLTLSTVSCRFIIPALNSSHRSNGSSQVLNITTCLPDSRLFTRPAAPSRKILIPKSARLGFLLINDTAVARLHKAAMSLPPAPTTTRMGMLTWVKPRRTSRSRLRLWLPLSSMLMMKIKETSLTLPSMILTTTMLSPREYLLQDLTRVSRLRTDLLT